MNDHQISMIARPSFVDDEDTFFNLSTVNKYVFDSYIEPVDDIKTLMKLDREGERNSVFADYAYALSVHSSQGSEFRNILLIDEMPRHRPEYSKWAYTGITRAMHSVDILLQ